MPHLLIRYVHIAMQAYADHPEWYDNFQLQYAATTLLMHEFEEVVDTQDNLPDGWDQEWFDKLNSKQRKERLIIAAALIAAELDRLELLNREIRSTKFLQ